MTTRDVAQWVMTTVQFIMIVIAGTFAIELATIWIRNRREERRNTVRDAEARVRALYDRERESWMSILSEKDRELENLNVMMTRLQKNYDIATRVLSSASEIKKEEA